MKTTKQKRTTKTNTRGANLKPAVQPPDINADVDSVIQNSIVLDLQVHSPSFRKKIDSDDIIDDGTDTDMVHVSKDLIDTTALTKLRRKKGELIRWLRLQEVPVPNRMLRGGMYLIPLDLSEKVDARILKFIAQRNELLDELIARYEDLIEDARGRLKEHFNPDDYPDPDKLREAFGVDADWRMSLNIPAALERVNKQIFERQRLKVAQQWENTAAEIPNALRLMYQKVIAHAVDRLGTDDETGKPRVFRDTFVEKINEFLATFEARNLTNVEDLNRLAQRMRKVMSGITNEKLRENIDTRQFVLREAEKIQAALDKAVTTQKRRRITLTRPESEAA